MKKVYEKPRVYVEKLQLAEHIASCDWDYNNNFQKPTDCYAEGTLEGFGTVNVFLENVNGCVLTDEYCNYTAEDKSVTFNS